MKVTIPYRPRPWQRAVHEAMRRFTVLVVHRRGGKTVLAINDAIRRLVRVKYPRARAAYIAPTYRQAKRVAWDYVKQFTRPIPGMKYRESELIAVFPDGRQLGLYGSDNEHAIRGEFFDHVVMDEVAQQSPRTWSEVVRPALADRKGSATFIGTPWGRLNLFYELWEYATEGRDGVTDPDWVGVMLTADDTGVLSDEELHQARREMSEASFRQEFYCDWSANTPGAFYGELIDAAEKEGRISDDVVHDASLPVIPAWDIGLRDATVITYWQTLANRTQLLATDAYTNTSIPDIANHVLQHRATWRMPYHIGPHDLQVRDPQQHNLTTRMQTAAQHGITFRQAPNRSREEGIEAVRVLLPRVHFNRTSNRELLEALRLYRAEYNDKHRSYARTPVHDWTSDYADSVRYFAVTEGSRTQASMDFAYSDDLVARIDRERERVTI